MTNRIDNESHDNDNNQIFALTDVINSSNDYWLYNNTEYNFQIHLPLGWYNKQLTHNQLSFFTEDDNNLRHSLSLVIRTAGIPASLDDATKNIIEEDGTFINNFNLLSTKQIMISSIPATNIAYTGEGIPLNNEDKLGVVNVVIFLKDNHLFKFSFNDDPVDFNNYIDNVWQIIGSFKPLF